MPSDSLLLSDNIMGMGLYGVSEHTTDTGLYVLLPPYTGLPIQVPGANTPCVQSMSLVSSPTHETPSNLKHIINIDASKVSD